MSNQDDIDELFYRALRGKTVSPEQANILEWAERRLKPAFRALIHDREVRARFVELDLLEQAINQGRDMNKYKLQRLADLEKRLDALHTAKESKEKS